MRGRPEVEMVEAFSEHERHLEAALAAARAPGATPEVRQNAYSHLAFIGRMRRCWLLYTPVQGFCPLASLGKEPLWAFNRTMAGH